jgi:hypothetical protein
MVLTGWVSRTLHSALTPHGSVDVQGLTHSPPMQANCEGQSESLRHFSSTVMQPILPSLTAPGGQAHSTAWLNTLHSAGVSQGFVLAQGSSHLLLMQALFPGHSVFDRHPTRMQEILGLPMSPGGH